jgi:tetratricopeptide (TPR) repeat protein
MNRAALVARVRTSESPALWLAAATACRLARRVSRHRSRWSSRLGYTLERLDQAREAAAGRSWASRLPGRGEAHRHLRLAQACQRGGDTAGAARAVRTACELDGSHAGWFGLLGDLEEASGDLPRAVAAYQRAAALAGDTSPRWRLNLADLYDRTGQWDEAQRVLRDNVAAHRTHALSHRRLGEVSTTLAHWGGAFTGTLGGQEEGRFVFDPAHRAATGTGRRALERCAELEPAKTVWRGALAEARLADGDPAGAAELYEAALRQAEESTGRWVLAVKHRWQFTLESIYHRLGRPRVEDPLFGCAVAPDGPAATGDQRVAGLFSAQFTFAGLAITGLVADPGSDHVEVLLDGTPVRAVNVGGDGFFPRFALELKRSTLASFPPHGQIEVRTPDGARLHGPGGTSRLSVTVPFGNGQLSGIIAAGGKLDKKGVISPSRAETRQRQERYLRIYDTVRDFFEERFGRPLFLLYGTLLGFHRDGDFIPGDDDFDAGYVSDETDPVAVKEETKRLIVELVRAGFTVSFNRKGRLFRVQLEREATDGFHLDMRPVWFQDGRVWVHNHCSFPSSRDEFLPVVEGWLRGVRVLAPRDTEAFLHGHYGPGWKVPDPGFMYYMSEVDPAVLDNLGKALITMREYRELAARVKREVGEDPPAGRLVSVGSQDLYPLDEFLA